MTAKAWIIVGAILMLLRGMFYPTKEGFYPILDGFSWWNVFEIVLGIGFLVWGIWFEKPYRD